MTYGTLHLRSLRQGNRRGAYLASVLVCLAVAMVLFATWLKTIIVEQRHVKSQALALQAEYLAVCGVERARAQLTNTPDFAGESWHIDAATLGQRSGAVVTIQIHPVPELPRARRIRVEAEYPEQGPRRMRRTQETIFELPTAGEPS